jgi:hypothetical protein
MTTHEEHTEFAGWSREWQSSGASTSSSEAEIREYVRKRGSVVRSFLFADLVIGAVMLPVLIFIAIVTDKPVERASMIALATITIGAVGFGWWNWRAVIGSSVATVSEFVDISLERLRRMRIAWRFAWLVLASEVIVFTIWIRDQFYSGASPAAESSERFAWSWLIGFSLAAAVGLVSFGRWLRRDEARFEVLRHDYSDVSSGDEKSSWIGRTRFRVAKKSRRPPEDAG